LYSARKSVDTEASVRHATETMHINQGSHSNDRSKFQDFLAL